MQLGLLECRFFYLVTEMNAMALEEWAERFSRLG
jgi:hypothetical protein